MEEMRSDQELVIASDAGPDVGGGYFNPPDQLLASCRLLDLGVFSTQMGSVRLRPGEAPSYVLSALYKHLSSQLGSSEILFAVYQRSLFCMAPYIYSAERLSDFERQVACGSLSRAGFYAVPKDFANEGLRRDFR